MSVDGIIDEAKQHGAVEFYQGILAIAATLGLFAISGGVPEAFRLPVYIGLFVIFALGVILISKALCWSIFGKHSKVKSERSASGPRMITDERRIDAPNLGVDAPRSAEQ